MRYLEVSQWQVWLLSLANKSSKCFCFFFNYNRISAAPVFWSLSSLSMFLLSYLCRNLSFISRTFSSRRLCSMWGCSGCGEQSVFHFCFHVDWYASLMPHIEPLSGTLMQKSQRNKRLMSARSFPPVQDGNYLWHTSHNIARNTRFGDY